MNSVLSPELQSQFDSVWTDALNLLNIFWTGWWPVLHYAFTYSIPELDDEISVDIGVDLLLDTQVYSLHFPAEMNSPPPESMSESSGSSIGDFWTTIGDAAQDVFFWMMIGVTAAALTVFEAAFKSPDVSRTATLVAGAIAIGLILYTVYNIFHRL